MFKKFFVIILSIGLFLQFDYAYAQEWVRHQDFVDATGNQIASPMRTYSQGSASDSYSVMPCTSEPIHPMVVVTAAHCIWGIYGDPKNAYSHNGGTIWIQEPGKKADDPTAKRVRVVKVLRPESLGNSVNFPTGKESQDDIAFLILQEPIVKNVKVKIATLDQIKFAIQNKLKMRVYGYGLNSIAEQQSYYSIQDEQKRYNVSNQLNPRKLEYDFVTDMLPSGYQHHVGMPKMVLAKLPQCGATGTSGSPAVIEIDGVEYLIGPGSHSTGWDCPELPNYETEKLDPNFKYRNIFSHIIISNYEELLKEALTLGDSLMPKQIENVPTVNNETSNTVLSTKKIKITIKCKKAKIVRIYTGYSPKCPTGYIQIKN